MSDLRESPVPDPEPRPDDRPDEPATVKPKPRGEPVTFRWTVHTVSDEEGRVVNEAQNRAIGELLRWARDHREDSADLRLAHPRTHPRQTRAGNRSTRLYPTQPRGTIGRRHHARLEIGAGRDYSANGSVTSM